MHDGFFFIVLGNDYVTTCSRGTAALFLPFQVLDTTHPVLPPPNSSPLRPLSRVVSSGEDAPSSRNVRPSTHSRRGRRGPGQFPCSASPDATRRFPAGEESDDVESPEGKASGAGTLDGSYHRSPGRRTGLSTAPRDTALPGRNRSVRQSRRGSNLSRTRGPTGACTLHVLPSTTGSSRQIRSTSANRARSPNGTPAWAARKRRRY